MVYDNSGLSLRPAIRQKLAIGVEPDAVTACASRHRADCFVSVAREDAPSPPVASPSIRDARDCRRDAVISAGYFDFAALHIYLYPMLISAGLGVYRQTGTRPVSRLVYFHTVNK